MLNPNHRSALLLAWAPIAAVASLIAVVLFIVAGLPWWLGVIIGMAAAAAAIWWVTRNAVDRLLADMGATVVRPTDDPRYENLVEGLSLSTGLAEPDLYILDDAALNGAALSGQGTAAIVVTTGLLQACDRIELEGVLAALLTRIKSGDADAATLAAVLFGRFLTDSGSSGPLSPIVTRAFRSMFSDHREIESDRAAVAVTRYPPGLLAALERILGGPAEPAGVNAGSQHLWFAPPRPAPAVPHSPIAWRLDVLSEA